MSLQKRDGSTVFHEPGKPHNMSDAMRWFVGGQQALMPELLAMVASTVNSYSRLVPGFWAPTSATWGIENRTTRAAGDPRRSPRASASSTGSPPPTSIRISRSPPRSAPDCGASSTASSPTRRSRPTPTIASTRRERRLPRTLHEAAERLAASKAARELFGDAFVEHHAATRQWEEREFRKAITDWELARYFEII